MLASVKLASVKHACVANDSFSESGKRNVNDTFSSPEGALLLVSTSGKIQFSERAQSNRFGFSEICRDLSDLTLSMRRLTESP